LGESRFLDPPGKVGLASLTGALVRRAGTTEIEAAELDIRIDHLGARLGSFAGITRGGASLSAPTWVLDEALDLFVEILRAPGFQMEQLQAAKDNLRESMLRRNEDPLEILEREWEWLMIGDSHFSTVPLTLESVEAITRQDLVAHHHRYWRPENMLIAVSGDFDRKKLVPRLEELFAAWPTNDDPATGWTASKPVPWPPAGPPAGAGPGLFHVEADTPQAKIALGYRAASRLDWMDPDRYALDVVLEIFGGTGAISRLAGRLRTAEGLVYRASAVYEVGTLWPEYFQVFFDTDSRNTARARHCRRDLWLVCRGPTSRPSPQLLGELSHRYRTGYDRRRSAGRPPFPSARETRISGRGSLGRPLRGGAGSRIGVGESDRASCNPPAAARPTDDETEGRVA
jgi:predicted Zn-dependent peptidase